MQQCNDVKLKGDWYHCGEFECQNWQEDFFFLKVIAFAVYEVFQKQEHFKQLSLYGWIWLRDVLMATQIHILHWVKDEEECWCV